MNFDNIELRKKNSAKRKNSNFGCREKKKKKIEKDRTEQFAEAVRFFKFEREIRVGLKICFHKYKLNFNFYYLSTDIPSSDSSVDSSAILFHSPT